MKNRVVVLMYLLVLLSAFGLPKNIKKKLDKELKKTFEIESYILENITITEALNKTLPTKIETDNLFKIINDNTFLGYAFIDKAPSKTAQFDYLVLLDKDLIVIKTKVLIYREEYGGEIGSTRWLKQFIGKTQNDKLAHGENIIAISGATISVRSMTNAMNNFLKTVKILHSENVI
ncbi:FMN-binding protein [Flavobacteriaceae bacterium AU392]|nr:FMN-binding protein [Flavobacteriaceae bacterium]RKM86811.1 FMN-binding protein [Flavobacteriaceae bacterium AU392]